MKLPTPLVALLLLCAGCTSSDKIDLERVSTKQYMYIVDFDSRVSQEKMRILRSNYKAGSVGVFLLDATANSLNDPRQPDDVTSMPKFFKKIRIINKGNATLFADLTTDLDVDHTYSCSIKNIQLPKGKSIKLLLAADHPYEFHWNYSGKEKNTYLFNSNGERVLKVSEAGVNPTMIYYNAQ